MTDANSRADNGGMERAEIDLSVLRKATRHAYNEARAEQVARDAGRFCVEAQALLAALERAL